MFEFQYISIKSITWNARYDDDAEDDYDSDGDDEIDYDDDDDYDNSDDDNIFIKMTVLNDDNDYCTRS